MSTRHKVSWFGHQINLRSVTSKGFSTLHVNLWQQGPRIQEQTHVVFKGVSKVDSGPNRQEQTMRGQKKLLRLRRGFRLVGIDGGERGVDGVVVRFVELESEIV